MKRYLSPNNFFVWIFIPFIFSLFVWSKYYKVNEPFVSSRYSQDVIDTFKDILNREPTAEELKKYSKGIENEEYTIEDLKVRLYNSEEYKQLIKTQTNMLTPEIGRIANESIVIDYVKKVYNYVFKKMPEKNILLQLKDIFIHLDYDEYKLLALFRHTSYKDFEEEFKSTKNLTKQKLIELIQKYFDDNKLTLNANALRKNNELDTLGKPAGSKIVKGVESTAGADIKLSETDTEKLLEYLLSKGVYLTDKNKDTAAKKLDTCGLVKKFETSAKTGATSTKIYLNDDVKIKKQGYGFSVPQKHPPVCIPVGEKNKVNPVVFGKYNGTPLNEATSKTMVGSMMPKFEYKEYIEIPKAL